MDLPKDRTLTAAVVLVLGSLALAVVLLSLQNRRLKDVARVAAAGPPQPETLAPGAAVPPLDVVGLDGTERVLPSRGRPLTLLYFFRTDCPACARTRPVWNRLSELVEGPCVEVAAVSREPANLLRTYAADASLAYDLATAARPEILADYSVAVVPQTVLVDSDGLVFGAWVGILDAAATQRIESLVRRLTEADPPCAAPSPPPSDSSTKGGEET